MTDTEKLFFVKLDEISQKVGGISQKLDELDQKVDELGQKVVIIENKVDVIENKVDVIENKVDVIENKVDRLEKKVDVIEQDIVELKQEVRRLDQRITDETNKIKIIIETVISKKIDIIGEGQDFLKQRLEGALQMEMKRENMELELVNLRMDNKKIKEHLDIA